MIIDALKEKFPQMQNLRVRDIRVDKDSRKIYCAVSYPDASNLSAEIVSAVKSTVVEQLPKGYRYDVRVVNDRFNEKSFLMLLLDLMKKRYPLFSNIKAENVSVKMQDKDIFAEFSVTETTLRNMKTANFFEELKKFFNSYTSYGVRFSSVVVASQHEADIAAQERLVQLAINKELLKPQRYFNVTDVQKCVGKEIPTKPMYISDIRSATDNCVVCGRISDKQIKDVKNNPSLKLCKFNLTDDSGVTIPCLTFVRLQIEDFETLKQTSEGKTDSEIMTISRKRRLSNEKKLKLFEFLYNGQEVLVRGKVVYSDFSQRLELQWYDLNKCKIQPLCSQPKFVSATPNYYVLVNPEPLFEYKQMSFAQMEEKPSLLSGKDCVVLFANTTGYSVTKDKIYNLCAVRLTNGHLKEKFATFVSPEVALSEQQLRVANASVRAISASPTLTEIIGDLYKFVGKSVLVGNDLPQLLELLNYYAAPLGYSFDNSVSTCADMLSSLFDASDCDSKPNCFVLADVVRALKLDCVVTESAEDVAVAVARCMSALVQRAV